MARPLPSTTISLLAGRGAALHDARRFQRPAIGPDGMMIAAHGDEGNVVDDAVEELPGDRRPGSEAFMGNAGGDDDPLVGTGFPELRNGFRNNIEAIDVIKHKAAQFDGAAEQMYVPLDDAGHHRVHSGVDHPRVFCLQRGHILIAAEAENAVAGNGDRFRPRPGRVHGQDFGIGDDDVGAGHRIRAF